MQNLVFRFCYKPRICIGKIFKSASSSESRGFVSRFCLDSSLGFCLDYAGMSFKQTISLGARKRMLGPPKSSPRAYIKLGFLA